MSSISGVILVLMLMSLHFSSFSIAKNATDTIKSQEEFGQLELSIEAVLKKYKLAGFQLSLNNKNETLWSMNYGVSSLSSGIPVDDKTLFRIGSISKTVTAVAIMQLVEQGKLELSTPIHTIIPEITISNPWRDDSPITVLHLLEHTAGFDDNHFKEFVVDGAGMTTKDALDYHPHTRTARYEPGQFMSYANVDPTLVAYIVEKLTDMSFEEYVKLNIFQPLGMTHSSYFFDGLVKDRLATGHIEINKNLTEAKYEFIKDRASGALNSNAAEIARFQQMLINKGTYFDKRLLASSLIERMAITESTLAAKAGFQEGYGKYLITQRYGDDKWLGHSGEMIGFLSAMWHSASRNVGYMFVTNTSNESSYEATREINNLLRAFIVEHYPEVVTENMDTNEISQGTTAATSYNPKIIGEYRRYTSRISLLGFIEQLESFSSVYIEAGGVKLKTSHSTYNLIAIGQNTFQTHLKNGDEIIVVFVEENGEWYYQIPSIFVNAMKTSSLTKLASYAILISFVVMALIVWGTLIFRGVLRLFKKKLTKSACITWLSVAYLGLFSCFLFMGSAGSSGMPLNILGQASIQSVGITVSLLVFGIFTLLSLFKFFKFKQYHQPNNARKVLTFIELSALFVNTVMLITLYYFDFLFVMLWTY